MLLAIVLAAAPLLGFAFSPLSVPYTSPATGLPNQFYEWKEKQSIRYQCAGPKDGEPLLLVHGLFVNSDHWRKSLVELSDRGYHVYAIDLFGCGKFNQLRLHLYTVTTQFASSQCPFFPSIIGYSDKPPRDSEVAQKVNGENSRFSNNDATSGVLPSIRLGSTNGKGERIRDVDLRHPLNSPYNFFTWADLLNDFVQDVILANDKEHPQVTLVSNSIGTISAFQAVLDKPDLYTGVFVVCPNFRELHSAEVAFSDLSMPILRRVQSLLRTYGQTAFDFLAVPDTVKQILQEPYAVTSAVDDTLVKVLLDPLLTPGASHIVFDTLSYSAGPLPEQQLQAFPSDKPVWVCYGTKDPWTPGPR